MYKSSINAGPFIKRYGDVLDILRIEAQCSINYSKSSACVPAATKTISSALPLSSSLYARRKSPPIWHSLSADDPAIQHRADRHWQSATALPL